MIKIWLNRSLSMSSANVSRSLTSHTISSAVKNDYAHRETQDKLRELAIPGEVKYVVPIDNTAGRRPFVVRHVSLFIRINSWTIILSKVNANLIGRKPKSHVILNEGLVVNDYSFSHTGSSMSLCSLNDSINRSRSFSAGARARSASQSRRSLKTSKSVDFERRGRSKTPQRRSNLRSSSTRLYGDNDYYNKCDGKSSFILIFFFFFYLKTI
jgi:hypothetical protein